MNGAPPRPRIKGKLRPQFVLHVLAQWGDGDPVTASYPELAEAMGLSRRRVMDLVAQLEADGLLRVARSAAPGLGQLANTYTIEEHAMSMHRAFPSTPVVGSQQSSAKVACSKCDATAEITTQTGSRRLPPDAIARKFKMRGWHIGHTPAKDRCPDCNGTPIKKPHQEETMGLHNENTVVELKAPRPGASDQAPREMTREDRRIIFVKLEEVYVDEATGYTKGWNDTAVAADLNCPRAWVEVIREENFGPQKADQSAEVIELRQRIADFEHEQTQLVLAAAALAKDAEKMAADARGIIAADKAIADKMKAVRDDLRKLVGGR